MKDRELLVGIRLKDGSCYEELIDRYMRYVAAVVSKVAGKRLNSYDIEEISSDVFIKVWLKSDSINLKGESMKAYLAIAARNNTLNVLRQKARIKEDELEETISDNQSAEDHLMLQQEELEINDLISNLTEKDQKIMIRRYYHMEKVKRNSASPPDIEAMIMTDEEIEELTRNIDFENIKMKAMNGIRKEKRTMKNNMRKTAIIAAAVVAIGGTVFAAEYFDAFKMFYGDRTNITSEDKTAINNEQTASGVKMTMQEGIIGDKSAIIMVAFENEDGSTFPEDARVKTLDFQGEKKQSFGYMVAQKVTADGTKLIGNFEIDTMDSIDGQNVIINADEIYAESTGKSLVTGPWKSAFKVDAKNSVHKESVDIQIQHQEEMLALNQISISALGVEIQGERLDAQKDRLPDYTPAVRVMMTDGKTTDLNVSSTIETENGFKWQYNMDKDGNFIFIDD